MSATVKIVENNKELIKKQLPAAIDAALEAAGLVAVAHAKVYETAVDTGLLRNSITHQVSKGEQAVHIGTNVEYAPYVEFGHRLPSGGTVPGVHFLQQTVNNHMPEYKALIEQVLNGF